MGSHLRPLWLAFVLLTMALSLCSGPTLPFRDSGELTAAAYVQGVAHPTGFPLYCVATKAAQLLLPAGDAFFRANLLSAVFMAAAAILFGVQAAIHAGTGPGFETSRLSTLVLMVTAAAFLCSPVVWVHSVFTEVYSLSAAGLAATLVTATMARRTRDARWFFAAYGLCGLGAGAHVTWPLYGALFLGIVAAPWNDWLGPRGRAMALAAAGVWSGLVCVAYLPVAAWRYPFVEFGEPSTFLGLLRHLTATSITATFAGELAAINPAVWLARLVILSRVLWQGSGVLIVFALAGLVLMTRKDRVVAAGLSAVLTSDLAFALFVNPMGLKEGQTSVVTFAVMGMAFAYAMGWAVRGLERRLLRAMALAALVSAIAFQWLNAPGRRFRGRDFGALLMVHQAFTELRPGALALTVTDDLSATLLAGKAVEDARPDVLFLPSGVLAERAWMRTLILHQAFVPQDSVLASHTFDSADSFLAALRKLATARPVAVEPGTRLLPPPRLRPAFPLFHGGDSVARKAGYSRVARLAAQSAMAVAQESGRVGKSYVGYWLRQLALAMYGRGMERETTGLLTAAVSLSPNDPRLLQNLGSILCSRAEYSLGIRYLMRACDADPTYARGFQSLARCARKAGLRELAAWAGATSCRLGGGSSCTQGREEPER